MALLHHPNIAQVYEFGVEDGTYFFTMEYVSGQNLRTILTTLAQRKEGMRLGDIIHIAVGVAAGLHHAHEQRSPEGEPLSIVHRDVSPANVIRDV